MFSYFIDIWHQHPAYAKRFGYIEPLVLWQYFIYQSGILLVDNNVSEQTQKK